MSSFLEKVAAARTQHQLAAEVAAAEQAKQNVEPPDEWVEQLRNIKGRDGRRWGRAGHDCVRDGVSWRATVQAPFPIQGL